jgi:hypothetical protein
MKRRRFGETKVWRDPLMTPAGRRREVAAAAGALDGDGAESKRRRVEPPKRTGARIIAGPRGHEDPRDLERRRLLGIIRQAAGRMAISKAVDDYLGAGFELPREQEVWLQLLEHRNEGRVIEAIEALETMLAGEEPQRRAVLESRLRTIEEVADDAGTRSAAQRLRRKLTARPAVRVLVTENG